MSIGIREHEFWHLTMRTLNAHIKANNLCRKRRDYENWLLGAYIQSAVSVAVEHNLAGRKAKSKYIENPFLQQVQKVDEEMTQEEMDREIQKMIFQEDRWISSLKKKGLSETII